MERQPSKKGKKFWGEQWWDGLHSGAAFYTPEHEKDFRLLIQGYKGNTPCKQCRMHFAQNLIKFPVDPYLTDSKKLLLWSYIVHDSVNQSHNSHIAGTGEPPKIYPQFHDVMKKYTTLPPETWDKSWRFILHSAAVVYTPESANDYVCLVKAFTGLIPSVASRVKFVQALEECPLAPYLRNNHDLFFWSYTVCSLMMKRAPVNASRLSKTAFGPETSTSYEDVKRYYFAGLGEDCKTCDV